MDLISSVLSALLFVVFVPGVFLTLPSKTSSRRTILVVHTLLFAVVTTFVMRYYWVNIKGYLEKFGNFGAVCPNGFVQQGNDCVPTGHATYSVDSGKVPQPSESSP
jgi:TRAP-type uncharacterized transport system fused permease subunit